jgi:hypothetical protein
MPKQISHSRIINVELEKEGSWGFGSRVGGEGGRGEPEEPPWPAAKPWGIGDLGLEFKPWKAQVGFIFSLRK